MLYVLAGLCYHNCVLLYVPCTLCKKPRCIREYNCFSLLINNQFVLFAGWYEPPISLLGWDDTNFIMLFFFEILREEMANAR